MITINSRQKLLAQKAWLLILVFGFSLFHGCVTNKKTTYMQEYPESAYTGEYTSPEYHIIKPNDNLHIRVSTLDPRLASIFNATAEGAGVAVSEHSTSLTSYTVQEDGNVDLPYMGFVEVAGKTISEAKVAIATELDHYVKDAELTVKVVNKAVTVLGEVRQPGMYPIYQDRLNIYQALALAGDVTDFGDRYNVRIVRPTMEGSIVKEFDLTDKNIIDSEFYYIHPADVIYVKPMEGKFWAMNQFPFAVIFSSITATISIILLIQTVNP